MIFLFIGFFSDSSSSCSHCNKVFLGPNFGWSGIVVPISGCFAIIFNFSLDVRQCYAPSMCIYSCCSESQQLSDMLLEKRKHIDTDLCFDGQTLHAKVAYCSSMFDWSDHLRHSIYGPHLTFAFLSHKLLVSALAYHENKKNILFGWVGICWWFATVRYDDDKLYLKLAANLVPLNLVCWK